VNGAISLVTLVLSVAFTGLLVEWIARARHPRRLFFVALGRERTAADDARATRLRLVNAAATLGGVVLVLLPGPDWLDVVAVIVAPLVSTLALVGFGIAAVRSAEPESVRDRWVVSLAEPPSWREYVSAPLQVANVLSVIVPSAIFAWLVGGLPARVPAHWNAEGVVDRYANPNELWMFAGILAFDLALLYVIVFSMVKERWALPERHADEYAALQLDRRRTMVRLVEWLMLLVNAGIAACWLAVAFGVAYSDPDAVGVLVGASVVLLLVATPIPLFVYTPRLTKIADGLRRIAGTEALGTRAAGWIAGGLLYYAPDDPALFVPKRVGIGQTLNFARPTAWIFMAAIVVIPLAITFGAMALAG
jgi:uncharacterized membrane protein